MNISANLLLSGKADATNRKGAHTPPLERNMDYMKKILVLEDEPSIRSFVVINLRRSGYEPIEAATGEEALEKLKQNPDTLVALLDVMLPNADGFELMEYIRPLGIPVIFLTARGSVDDRVRGLRMGAEDYIVKPFEVLELLARVDVVLRRYNKTDAVIEIGGLRIDTRAMQVWRGAEEIALTHKEYDLLLFFARNPGTALYRETIYEHVWGGEYSYGSKTVDLHIQRLRKKVGWENRLLAVNKVGYRLEV